MHMESKFDMLTEVAAASEKIPEPPLPKPSFPLSTKSTSGIGSISGSNIPSMSSVSGSSNNQTAMSVTSLLDIQTVSFVYFFLLTDVLMLFDILIKYYIINGLCDRKTDWHFFLTVEERNNIRASIKSAYKKKTVTYEELLEVSDCESESRCTFVHTTMLIYSFIMFTLRVQTCAAIEEELVFLSAPSRLDYFKTGIQVHLILILYI